MTKVQGAPGWKITEIWYYKQQVIVDNRRQSYYRTDTGFMTMINRILRKFIFSVRFLPEAPPYPSRDFAATRKCGQMRPSAPVGCEDGFPASLDTALAGLFGMRMFFGFLTPGSRRRRRIEERGPVSVGGVVPLRRRGSGGKPMTRADTSVRPCEMPRSIRGVGTGLRACPDEG